MNVEGERERSHGTSCPEGLESSDCEHDLLVDPQGAVPDLGAGTDTGTGTGGNAIGPSGCPLAQAGGGFDHQSIGQPGEVVVSWQFVATPDRILDGVIGLSKNRAAAFADLAAAVRFAPSGVLDVRDGNGYRADVVAPYRAGESREFRIVADVASQTYSVFVTGDGGAPIRLANRYAFRSPGTPTNWISELAAIVDSPTGSLEVCDRSHGISIGVRFLRDGNYAMAPLPNQELLISDGATTWRLSSSGRVIAQLARGGQIAVDPAGTIYLARIAGSALVVESYTAAFLPRWTRSYPAGDAKRVLTIGADAASVVAASGPTAGGVDLVKRWLVDGTESTTHTGPMADAIAIGPTGFVLGSAINGNVVVTKWAFGPTQGPTWQKSWQNGARIDAMALGPTGRVYFGGRFSGPISFGGPVVAPGPDSSFDTYLAALDAGGDAIYTSHLRQSAVYSVAATNGAAAIATPRGAMVLDDFDGHEIRGELGQNPVRGAGVAAPIAIDSGRVYWNFQLTPLPGSPSYPYLMAFNPGT